MKNKTWEERFEELLKDEMWLFRCEDPACTSEHRVDNYPDHDPQKRDVMEIEEIKSFIRSLLVEEVKRVVEGVEVGDMVLSAGTRTGVLEDVANYISSEWRIAKLKAITDYENEMKNV